MENNIITVACQGTPGAYSQIAADNFIKNPQITYTRTFDGVFNAVDKGLCKYGVLPLENSNAGSVTAVYHLMNKYAFYIVKSLKLPVSHCLLAKEQTDMDNITDIYTHEQAAAQCSLFIEKNPHINLHIRENTAVSAKYVAESDNPNIAAIASASCSELYNLKILAKNIENNAANYTRFILISKDQGAYDKTGDRLSMILTLPHKPGSLFECLKQFKELNINLTKIESIPIAGTDFEFMFYFDCLTDINTPVDKLLITLNKTMKQFVFLGFYSEIQPLST